MQSATWQDKLKAMIPSYGRSLIQDAELTASVRQRTLTTLKLAP
jgi:malate dehydrogenase (quinone)